MSILSQGDTIEEDRHQIFTAGENETTEDQGPQVSEPAIVARRFLQHRAASVKEEVSSTIVLSEGVTAFNGDRDKISQLLHQLAKAKVLSAVEVAEGLFAKKSGSMASKLKKIGENGKVLLHPKILPFLQPGYSVLYEIVLLYEALDEERDRVDVMHELLKAHDGPATRDWLKKEREKCQKAASPAQADDVPHESRKTAETTEPGPEPDAIDDATPEPARAETDRPQRQLPAAVSNSRTESVTTVPANAPITAVLITANSRDVSRISKAFDQKSPPKCLRVSEEIGEEAVLLVHAKLGTLLSMADAIEFFDFDRCSRIYLLAEPSAPDVTDSLMLAVYERGGAKIAASVTDWHSEKAPVKIADRLLDGLSGRRVHLFAKANSTGWESIIADENWRLETEHT